MKVYMTPEKGAPLGDLKMLQEGSVLRLFFDWKKEEPVEEGADEVFTCENVDVVGARDYGAIVSAIVNSRYTADDVQAVLANHALAQDEASDISDEKRAEYLTDYGEFQAWRAHAKEVAKRVLEQLKA